MARDAKYGNITVENTPGNPLGDDEPVFLLRGRDKTTPFAIREWAHQAYVLGASNETVKSAMDRADEIKEWQDQNRNLVKIPD